MKNNITNEMAAELEWDIEKLEKDVRYNSVSIFDWSDVDYKYQQLEAVRKIEAADAPIEKAKELLESNDKAERHTAAVYIMLASDKYFRFNKNIGWNPYEDTRTAAYLSPCLYERVMEMF